MYRDVHLNPSSYMEKQLLLTANHWVIMKMSQSKGCIWVHDYKDISGDYEDDSSIKLNNRSKL